MNNPFFNHDDLSAYKAQYEAQKIAFAPIVFQVTRIMRDKGLLELLYNHRKQGLSFEEITQASSISTYGLKILLETGLSANIVKLIDAHYFLTKIGFYVLKDEMTQINMDYNHYVNYQALFYLDESIDKGKPIGLKNFGDWRTIYPGISALPKKTRQSWFKFDHYYSDSAFPDVLQEINKRKIKSILDVGGNTGKFSLFMTQNNPQLHFTLVDLPEQIEMAQKNISEQGMEDRIHCHSADVLQPHQELPKNHDIIWMSQFLDCFNEQDCLSILHNASQAMSQTSELWIMEPLWDRQQHETSAFCIINTSPYFTTMANGCSKMYHAEELIQIVEKAHLEIIEIIDHLGLCQSLIRCKLIDQDK